MSAEDKSEAKMHMFATPSDVKISLDGADDVQVSLAWSEDLYHLMLLLGSGAVGHQNLQSYRSRYQKLQTSRSLTSEPAAGKVLRRVV